MMFKIPCRCGRATKTFKNDIGEFFIDECCIAAGYDHLGNHPDEQESEVTMSDGLLEKLESTGEADKEPDESEKGDDGLEKDGLTEVEQHHAMILMKKSSKQLQAMAAKAGIKLPAKPTKKDIVKKLVAANGS